MKRRDAIYVALLAFVAAGMLVDSVVWPQAIPDFTPNDVVQMIGIIVLVSWWQIEDASGRGALVGRTAKWMTILFAPAGSAVYLVQSRGWSRASAARRCRCVARSPSTASRLNAALASDHSTR